jgi:hypothetical protein
MSTDMNPIEHSWDYLGGKVNASTPKRENIQELCFSLRMSTVPSAQTETLGSRNEDTWSGTVQDARRLDSLLTVSWVIKVENWLVFIFRPDDTCFGGAISFNRGATAAFFHTFGKTILVIVKNWWSLTHGQVYILSIDDGKRTVFLSMESSFSNSVPRKNLPSNCYAAS